MPIARIRTSDPEAISFLAAKLADSGFQVQFARPGESLSGEVDLEITVNRIRKGADFLERDLVVSTADADVLGAWTTPYHAEARVIPETAEPGDESEGLDIPWNDRELARILATGSSRVHIPLIAVEEQTKQEIAIAGVEGSAALRIVEVREPVLVSRPSPRLAKSARAVHMFTPVQGTSNHSFRQRFASVAAMVVLAVTAVFSLTLSGDRPNPTETVPTPVTQRQTEVPAPPISTPPSAALPFAGTDVRAPGAATSSEPSIPSTKSAAHVTQVAHKKHHGRRVSRKPGVPPPAEEPEVIVRHFPAGDE